MHCVQLDKRSLVMKLSLSSSMLGNTNSTVNTQEPFWYSTQLLCKIVSTLEERKLTNSHNQIVEASGKLAAGVLAK